MVAKLVPRGSKRNGASEKVQSMTISTNRSAMPLARVVTTTDVLLGATLLGSTFLAGPLSAQTAATPPAVASDAAGARTETVEQRIVDMHQKLMITTPQEAAWASVAQVMRDNSTAMEKLIAANNKAKKAEDMTALDDLMTYQSFAQAHFATVSTVSPTPTSSIAAASGSIMIPFFGSFLIEAQQARNFFNRPVAARTFVVPPSPISPIFSSRDSRTVRMSSVRAVTVGPPSKMST